MMPLLSAPLRRLRLRLFDLVVVLVLLLFFSLHVTPSLSLNAEGLALLKFKERVWRDPSNALSNWNPLHHHPCSWSGVRCSLHNFVISLNLKHYGLGGTLGPELGCLSHIEAIILRNNSFSGTIPKEIAELKELRVLDLGYNNFSGTFPTSNLGNNLSVDILLLDDNEFIRSVPPEVLELQMLSEYQLRHSQLLNASTESNYNHRNNGQSGDVSQRRLLHDALALKTHENVVSKVKSSTKSSTSPAGSHTAHSPSQSSSKSPVRHQSRVPAPTPSQPRHHHTARKLLKAPSPSPRKLLKAPSPSPRKLLKAPSPSPQAIQAGISSHPASNHSAPGPSPSSTSGGSLINITSKKNKHLALVWSLVAIGGVLITASVIGIIICQNSRAVAVKPWATGISGKLQKAFVSGVPNLRRLELEAACEEFSNIIGSLSDGTVYKGTLSSGVEIAVVSTFVKSSQLWTPELQAQFRKKIATLSKVNHKNFVNLIGHCEEDQPFSRMMVFEYAPNGSLFEHLHIQEAERLDWGTRLRIIMGMAYCLEYMHQLSPPIAHRDLHSSSIYLTEDYAAKISDFSFWSSQVTTRRMVIRSPSMELLDTQMVDLETNVYNFGVILFEMITGGEILDSAADGCLTEWTKEYLRRDELPDEAIDPTLTVSPEDKVIVQGLFTILKDCLHSDPRERPTMREVTSGLRKITRIEPSGATPGLSPLWWAELDILSTDGTTEV
ncbi:hypothetical protein Droror1_Dr00004374 [Drosera rotundifolia]